MWKISGNEYALHDETPNDITARSLSWCICFMQARATACTTSVSLYPSTNSLCRRWRFQYHSHGSFRRGVTTNFIAQSAFEYCIFSLHFNKNSCLGIGWSWNPARSIPEQRIVLSFETGYFGRFYILLHYIWIDNLIPYGNLRKIFASIYVFRPDAQSVLFSSAVWLGKSIEELRPVYRNPSSWLSHNTNERYLIQHFLWIICLHSFW
jgi:hypothetical protein